MRAATLRKDRPEVATLESTAAGLCSTCANEPTCTLPRALGAAVLTCDEVDTLVVPVEPATGREHTPRFELMTHEHDADHAKGLCADCSRREGCTYPKPPGGVWHCEEFA